MDIMLEAQVPTGFPMAWQWHRKTKRFSCDNALNSLLGGDDGAPADLKAIARAVAPEQLKYLKHAIELAAKGSSTQELNLEFLLGEQRCVAQMLLWSESNEVVSGSFEIVLTLPSKTEEVFLIRDLFERSVRAVVFFNHELKVVMANKAAYGCLGVSSCELLSKQFRKLLATSYSQKFYRSILDTTMEQGVWQGELLMAHASERVIAFNATLVVNKGEVRSQDYFVLQLETSSFSLEEIANNTPPHDWAWTDKNIFFERVDSALQNLSKSETLLVFSLKGLANSEASPALLEWLVAQNTKNQHLALELGTISAGIITGLIYSGRRVKDISSVIEQTMRQLVCERPEEASVSITAEVGISVLGADASNSSQLINNAIKAMVAGCDYHTTLKEQNVNCKIKYYDTRLAKANDRKRCLVSELEKAVSKRQIQAVYQPIVNTKTLDVVKVEALCRVNLDKDIKHTTQELIEIAEEYDWVDQIDQEVTRQAIKDLPYLEQVFDNPALGLSINRSMVEGHHNSRSLEATFEQLLSSKVDLSKFTIEITESSVFAEDKAKIKWINRLHKQGVCIAIDDFGTGYTSFSYLSLLPASIVKIDKSLITDIENNPQQRLMVKMFTDLVHQLDGEVIAEGVEFDSEFYELSKIGVDYIQGYLFSQPKAVAEHKTTVARIRKCHKDLLSAPVDTIAAIADRNTPTIPSTRRIGDCIQLFDKFKFIAVVDESYCRGILFEADARSAISPYVNSDAETKHDQMTLNKRAHYLMKKPALRFPSRTPIEQVVPYFKANPYQIVVMEGKNGVFLGIVSIQEILEYL